MKTEAGQDAALVRRSAFGRRVAGWFVLQLAVAITGCAVVARDHAWLLPVVAALVATSALAWAGLWRAWRPVGALARLLGDWRDDAASLRALEAQAHSTGHDAEFAMLAGGVHGLARRVADYGERERNFTRDASHELRTPLTVIRMAVDMLADDSGLGDAGQRSVRRIHRATRELEALVEVLLILARESDPGCTIERFVVNEVLRRELETARELMAGQPLDLQLDEPASFALQGSVRAFSVLCWQLIRDACQHAEDGRVRIVVQPAAIIVSHEPRHAVAQGARHSFELAIAQRISDRFAWQFELQGEPGQPGRASVRFPAALPAVD